MTTKAKRAIVGALLTLTAITASAADKPRCTTNRVTMDTVCQFKGAEIAWTSGMTGAGDVWLYTINGVPRLRFVWTPRPWTPQAAMVNVDGTLTTLPALFVGRTATVGLPVTETYDAVVDRATLERMANGTKIYVALTAPENANPASTVVNPKVARRWLQQLDALR